jgi:O-antigen ligase
MPIKEHSWHYFFFTCGIFLVGAIALIVPHGYGLSFYVMCLLSLVLWFKGASSLVSQDAKFFVWPIWLYAFGSGAQALYEKLAWRELDYVLPFLLLPFGFWGLRQYKPKDDWFWMGLAMGAIGAMCLAAFQSLHLGMRAAGFTNAIQFGNVALLMGVLCLVRALGTLNLSWMNALLWCGFVSGLAASVWSQTRGGWLAVVFIFLWVLFTATKNWSLMRRVMVVFAIFVFLAIPALQPDGKVQQRIGQAVTELDAFFQHGKQDTSVGARLAMWSVTLQELSKAPLFGIGNQGWVEVRDAALQDGRLDSFSSTFGHVHNEYLNLALKRGLFGLTLYLGLLMVPMLWFFKPYVTHANADVRTLAMAGMVIPMMYMDFGLTQTFLSHNSGRMALVSLWVCVGALMLNSVENQQVKSLN